MMRLLALFAFLFSAPAWAHELRPAYLDLRETAPDVFAVIWKVPARGDMRLGVHARLPEACKPLAEPGMGIRDQIYVERWTARCEGGLKGGVIRVEGLASTLTDTLVHITWLGGTTETARLAPAQAAFTVAGPQTALQTAGTYFRLGVEHILTGYDHLLFVLALMLLIPNVPMLVKTITAFTLAHSLTLTGAALGYLSLPQRPVEAVIALSIAFVARELIRQGRGPSQAAPWMVAFIFGLLHGLGFAGALAEIGLPQSDVPLALLAFNLGVEAGQLVFITGVMAAFTAFRAVVKMPIMPARTAAGYVIGTTAMLWLVQRIGGLGG